MGTLEATTFILDEADVETLSPRRQARVRRAVSRFDSRVRFHAWDDPQYWQARQKGLQDVKLRRGKLLLRWWGLVKTHRYGRLKLLAAEFGTSRWTLWRDVEALNRERLIRHRRTRKRPGNTAWPRQASPAACRPQGEADQGG